MPQKLLYNFPIRDFLILRGTTKKTKHRSVTVTICSAAPLCSHVTGLAFILKVWYDCGTCKKEYKKAPDFKRINVKNQEFNLVTRTGIEPMLQP